MPKADVSEEQARTLFRRVGAPFPEPEPEPAEPEPERSPWDTIDDFLKGPKPETEPSEEPTEPTPVVPKSPFDKKLGTPGKGIFQRFGNVHAFSPERPVGKLAERVGSLPTPGGLFPWLAILFVLLFALVPVNGRETRLSLMWRSMSGGARLPKDQLGQLIDAQWAQASAGEQVKSQEQAAAQAVWTGFWSVAQQFGGAGGSAAAGAGSETLGDGALPLGQGGWSPMLN